MADDMTEPLAETGDVPIVKLSYQAFEESAAKKPFSFDPWVKAMKVLAVAGIVLAYPLLTVTSHDIIDAPVDLSEGRHWSAPEAGVAATLITRELNGPGWAADRHRWHPQSRLIALPAWQAGLVAALADHGRLTLSLFEGQRDQDLATAVRLLGRSDDGATEPRLGAAREALTRYDGRVAAGLAGRPQGLGAL
ncbi:MAG: hypothetical protein AAGJ50_12740, partial [Pseudomonadota bacterium]